MKSAVFFQKVSVIIAGIVVLLAAPTAAGTAFADEQEPGWQTPTPVVGDILPTVIPEPGWQIPPAGISG
ncbi:hypothetical protein ACFWBN_27360 [Streptomyces sp. NPDC059989]|uniref:hypothetical protein n=1 Tax=Streptomyces sp. NPDC059989 TaxID=3347026 RepID=UPI0036951E6D